MTIRTAFSFGVEIAGLDRLVLIHKVSLIMPLPISYQERLRATEGVTLVTHNSWFGGVYQDPSNFFAQIVVDPEPFMQLYPEYTLPPDQIQGVACRSAGRDRRRRSRDGASTGRSAIAFRSRARSGSRSRARSGSSTSPASTTARPAWTRRSSSSATTTSTRTAAAVTDWSAGTSSRSPTRRRRSRWAPSSPER